MYILKFNAFLFDQVIKAQEDRLTDRMTELLTKTAGLTAERMAARLEKVAASGSTLVSDMSATVAAGRDKVTDALSRSVSSFSLPKYLPKFLLAVAHSNF